MDFRLAMIITGAIVALLVILAVWNSARHRRSTSEAQWRRHVKTLRSSGE